MGEKAHLPNENNVSKENNENMEHLENSEDEDTLDLDDMSPEEFQMLDNQLDALNSALDDIEQKNDNIHAQLLQLLQSNREMRQQMKESHEPENKEAEEKMQ